MESRAESVSHPTRTLLATHGLGPLTLWQFPIISLPWNLQTHLSVCLVFYLLGTWFPQEAPPGDNLRLEHYSCSFKTLIKPQGGLGPVLIPTFPPLLSWRSPFTYTSAGWKGATSHLPSLSRGSVTNENSLALTFHPLWPMLLQDETFQGSISPQQLVQGFSFVTICVRNSRKRLSQPRPDSAQLHQASSACGRRRLGEMESQIGKD